MAQKVYYKIEAWRVPGSKTDWNRRLTRQTRATRNTVSWTYAEEIEKGFTLLNMMDMLDHMAAGEEFFDPRSRQQQQELPL
jgi:hypothetical protein